MIGLFYRMPVKEQTSIHLIHIAGKILIKMFVVLLQEDTMKLSDFLEEAAIMKEMKHPNLVQVTNNYFFSN